MPYEKGVTTVICNETGGLLTVDCIKTANDAFLNLGLTEPDANGNEYGDFVDLEDVTRPSMIPHSGINDFEARGIISFHPKGSKPRGAKRVTLGPGVAPPNAFDIKLNELYDKEARDEERSKQQSRRRASPAGIGSGSLTPSRGSAGR